MQEKDDLINGSHLSVSGQNGKNEFHHAPLIKSSLPHPHVSKAITP